MEILDKLHDYNKTHWKQNICYAFIIWLIGMIIFWWLIHA